jgi:hypothetical protein
LYIAALSDTAIESDTDGAMLIATESVDCNESDSDLVMALSVETASDVDTWSDTITVVPLAVTAVATADRVSDSVNESYMMRLATTGVDTVSLVAMVSDTEELAT